MAIFDIKDLKVLEEKIRKAPGVASAAAALAINKGATKSIRLAIDDITSEVNLQTGYVKSKIKTVARAKSSNLRAVVHANERGTLLTRYPYIESGDGVRIAVNRTGGRRTIKKAWVMKKPLRGSGRSAIVLRNKDAVDYFSRSLSKGKKTPAKSRKLQKIISKARTKPYGVQVLHSRSINQLYTSSRENIRNELTSFMIEEFYKDFNRMIRR